jgi:cell division septation protein DedD
MLSGPDRSKTQSTGQGSTTPAASQGRSDAPIKTYTIDLTQSPGSQPVVTPEDNRAPPPEEEAPPPATTAASTPPSAASNGERASEGGPPNPQGTTQAEPETRETPGTKATTDRETVARTAAAAAPNVVEPPTNPASSASRARPAPQTPSQLASGATAPTSAAWAVQLGSFSKQSTAERLVQELQAKGHTAFVMPVRSGSATLYRVRIGPMKDRSSAETTLRAVQSIAPGAAIVAQP